MSLDVWRIARGWSYSDLARALGTSAETARRYCLRTRLPTVVNIHKIVKLTGGEVSVGDFYASNQPADLL